MYLKTFSFRENAGQNIEWLIDQVSLGEINLVVGKNSKRKNPDTECPFRSGQNAYGQGYRSIRTG